MYSKIIDGLIKFRKIHEVPHLLDKAIEDKSCLKKKTMDSLYRIFRNDSNIQEKLKIIKKNYIYNRDFKVELSKNCKNNFKTSLNYKRSGFSNKNIYKNKYRSRKNYRVNNRISETEHMSQG